MAVIGDAYVVVHAITKGFESEVRRATRGINLESDGSSIGESFSKGFSLGTANGLGNAMGDFGKQAEAARKRFQTLIRTSYVVGPALSILVSSVGSLAGGFVALAGSIAGAIPSLVVLPGLFSAIGLSALTAVAAFSGVGKAISAGMKTTTGAKVNTDQLANSQKALARAIESSVEAQERFTKATRDAKEEIQQLSFDAEDAAIAEKKAAIELEKARETLSRTQDLPPNSRARREAQLAFAEAELNLRKAKDRNKDLATEQNRLSEAAAKAGTEQYQQTETYKNAQKGVLDALVNQKDAEDALNKAKSGGSSAIDAFQTALDNLSPAAQSFVKFMVNDFVPSLKKLRDAAAETLLPQIQAGLTTLKTQLFPELRGLLAGLGKDVGVSFKSIISAIVDESNKADLAAVFKQSGYVIRGIGKSIGSTYGSILSILTAADPIIRKFTDFLKDKTAQFDKFLNVKQASGELQKFFDKAGDIAARWGEIFGNVFSGVSSTIKAIFAPGGAGDYLLNWFRDSTAAFEKFSGSAKGQNYLSTYFKDVSVNARSVLSSLGAFTKEILKAGADPNVAKFWDTLKTAAPSFGNLLKELNNGGPALAEFIKSIIKFTELTATSGAITAFFETLTGLLNALNDFLSIPAVKAAFDTLGTILATFSALGLAASGVSFGFKVFIGNLNAATGLAAGLGKGILGILPSGTAGAISTGFYNIGFKALTAFDKVKAGAKETAKVIAKELGTALKDAGSKVLDFGKTAGTGAINGIKSFSNSLLDLAKTGIKSAVAGLNALRLAMLANPITIVIAAIALLVAGFVTLYMKNEAFREAVNKLFEGIKTVISNVLTWLKTNWPLVLAILTGPLGLAVLAIAKNWDSIVAYIKGIPAKVRDALSGLWNGLTDGLKTAWANAKAWWNANVASKTLKIGGAVVFGKTLPSFTLGFPQLAKGGVVQPSPGGTIARIGEAGRAERVEPLDPDGLSQRDKAMIKLLSGGQGAGMTVNVYPSPGMNESELASMVSRQIAFQLRRGGA